MRAHPSAPSTINIPHPSPLTPHPSSLTNVITIIITIIATTAAATTTTTIIILLIIGTWMLSYQRSVD